MIAPVPPQTLPYHVVVFTSLLRTPDPAYEVMAQRMVELARNAPGFLGMDSARGTDGLGITVSYWTDEAAIAAWKADTRHLAAQRLGNTDWYATYSLHVARVERAYAGPRDIETPAA
ncbi:antibiotic biosynthesis monooxygenase [Meridianimarinicoccus sp. MJW13]|uniref:antibiotic biosynthesis monooxygenase family protein n=1 Tax=Meridianimarinicoccus sp. MJW13 TaxID=2720031 RepID=UPI0018691449|nr:antibiotic biosynthesis monooxygenase [Fluviibacterium sp. MJW13]